MIFGLLLAAATASPSFDCSRARTGVEKLICASAELSELDREEARLYRLAMAGPAPRQARAAPRQRVFLKERDACADHRSGELLVECIRDAYLGDIAELRRLFPLGSGQDGLSSGPIRYSCDEGYPDAYVTRFRFPRAQAYVTIPAVNEGQPLLAAEDDPQRLVGRYSNGMVLEPGGARLRLNARICTPAH